MTTSFLTMPATIYFVIPLLFQITSVLFSIWTLYKLYIGKRIHFRVKQILMVIQCWNVMAQIGYHYIYFYVVKEETFITYRGYSAAWVITNGLLYSILVVNLFILNLFSSLNPDITRNGILIAQWSGFGLFLAFQIMPTIGLWTDYTGIMGELEQILGIIFAVCCTSYDNLQAFYLVRLIHKFHLNHKKSKSGPVLLQLKKTTIFNSFVVAFDWISVILFAIQMSFMDGTPGAWVSQQVCASMAGFHSACIVLVFQNLRQCAFPTRPATSIADLAETPQESPTVKTNTPHTVQLAL